jgi:CPA1 family monovalent cation:H+ antiporter
VETALGLLLVAAVVVTVTATAERIRFSAPLLLMLVGIAASYLPGVSLPPITPQLVLVGFLPPLLYAAAIRTSVIDFRANKRPIGYLSVLLVVVTALGVGLVTWLILPVPFAVAFALGAVVAPPDAVATTSIARRVGMPRRMVTILEGESLVNDATAITCLRLAIVAIGGAVGIADVTFGFLIAAGGGVVVGLAVAALAVLVRKHIRQPVFDTAVSMMLPFAAYLPAEAIHYHEFHGSGVIAVVAAGLILGHKSAVIQSAQSRVSERVNWATIQFLLENTVFLLIGLQARGIVTEMANSPLSAARIAGFCAAVLAAVIILRLAWVTMARSFLFRRDTDVGDRTPRLSHSLVVGWAGMRGVVTLATALLIPPGVEHREVLIFAAMVVTAGTLLLQGLTLPALVRALHLRGPDARSDALQAATVLQTASNAAIEELDRIREPDDTDEAVSLVRSRIAARPDAMWEKLGRRDGTETPAEEYRRLRLATLATEREEVLKIRSSGTVDHDVIEEVLAALDVEESMLTISAQRAEQLDDGQTVATPHTPQGACDHLASAPLEKAPAGLEVCEDCIREGTRTVHLRICLHCGKVACCDSSPAQHATRHFRNSRHPVVRSFEPGESWRWCFIDERIG